jgi:hypothetical protein
MFVNSFFFLFLLVIGWLSFFVMLLFCFRRQTTHQPKTARNYFLILWGCRILIMNIYKYILKMQSYILFFSFSVSNLPSFNIKKTFGISPISLKNRGDSTCIVGKMDSILFFSFSSDFWDRGYDTITINKDSDT